MDKPDHVLIVDEDRGMREFVASYLEKNGMRVSLASSGRDMHAVLDRHTPDVILLDVMLPGEDGLALCRGLRAGRHRAVPVMMVTEHCDEMDRIIGLEMGVDDYLAKPCAVRELLARIRAVLRRTRMLPPGMLVEESTEMLSFGDWRLDTTARHLLDTEDAVVALSGAEYRLLRAFLDHPQRVLTRDQLLNLTQRRNAEPFDRSIDLLVSRLRQRLRDVARVPRYIKTLRNEGYVFSSTVKAVEEARARQHA
ncbi:response regulator [Paraburkholderia hospita]|uniref:response regulator n=1 Tax=Paraburkholderia hospita TaxID=169430 RepID=UPI0009A62FEB|nr:response regulator [Paraburkholderia hospita]SKC90718.1 two component transcriptional regulator, winged helix family [Paraburkholderia hospita]